MDAQQKTYLKIEENRKSLKGKVYDIFTPSEGEWTEEKSNNVISLMSAFYKRKTSTAGYNGVEAEKVLNMHNTYKKTGSNLSVKNRERVIETFIELYASEDKKPIIAGIDRDWQAYSPNRSKVRIVRNIASIL